MSIQDEYTLRCDLCHFDLCWRCATVPEKIWHMSDDEHPLTLWWNQMVVSWVPQERDEIWWWCLWGWTRSNQLVLYMLWLWSYSDVECALGDFSRLMPGSIYIFEGRKYEVVLNNHNTRPFCSQCHSRCKPPVILKEYGKDNGYICCYLCLSSFLRIQL